MTEAAGAPRIAVIGLGNPLMGDDGFGIAALDRLRAEWAIASNVQLVDGATWGLSLLPIIEAATHVVILDAVRAGLAPGTVAFFQDEDVPRRLSTKLSPHQIDLREILALAQLRGTLPRKLVVIGVEPLRVELLLGLSDLVAEKLDQVVALAVDRVHAWGGSCILTPSLVA